MVLYLWGLSYVISLYFYFWIHITMLKVTVSIIRIHSIFRYFPFRCHFIVFPLTSLLQGTVQIAAVTVFALRMT